MKDRLYKDLNIEIFSYLSFHQRWRLAQTCKYYYEIFKCFEHPEVITLDNKKINENEIKKYLNYFKNIKFKYIPPKSIRDVSALGNVHTLDLSLTNISNVSTLGNVHTLDLRWCNNIKKSDIEILRKTVKKLFY